jgi:hypothetical protein
LKRLLVLLCIYGSILAACEFFPESTFELSPDSRLPGWFSVPQGMSRSDLTVTMSNYVKPIGRTATFELFDSQKHRLAKLSGTLRGLEPLHISAAPPPGSPPGYPSYEVITVNGIVDIVEHRRMEPSFYVTDDSRVWRELGVPAN